MEPDPKMSNSDDDNYMADAEIEATSGLMETARQGFRVAGSTNTPTQKRVPPTFLKYDPSGDSAMFDSVTAKSRLFRLSDTLPDLPDPPKFRRRRYPGPGRPPPVPVMSSPRRDPSRKDQSDWKLPPCISGWKNPRGHTIPLGKRLRSSEDGEDVRRQNSDNFARLLEWLRAAETKAREANRMRIAEQKELRAKLIERRERELRQLAATALVKRAAHAAATPAAPPPAVRAAEESGAKIPEAKHSISEIGGADAEQQLKKAGKTDQGLAARAAGKRERPVELDEPEQSDGPFDLDGFMAQFASLGMDEFDLDELLQSMLHIK